MSRKLFSDEDVGYDGKPPVDPGSIKKRVTALNSDFKKNVRKISRSANFTISANLFKDAEYDIEFKLNRNEERYDVYFGVVEGDEDSDAVLTTDGRIITLSVYHEDRGFQVVPLEQEIYLIEEIDRDLSPDCDTGSHEQGEGGHHDTTGEPEFSEDHRARANTAGTAEIQVLILYTPSVRTELRDVRNGVEGFLRQTVEDFNYALHKSNIDAVIKWTAQEADLEGLPDGYCSIARAMRKNDSVKRLRAEAKADLVSLIDVKDGSSCADCLGSINGNRMSAFSGVNLEQARQRHSFIHELGHNLGCAHDPKNADCEGAEKTARGNSFKVGGTRYGTIMSYVGIRILRFSGLGVYYKGVETGTRSRDNAATLRKTAPKVAAYAESFEET
ncbi:M12 family metallo-peptidase [Sinorhizobium meliloti]|uniref:M12 family metallo-peptidase n=1 Tax=Rhizobium meliloti TaxID=382 RepID=UPI0013E38020|nr:M12 family metallo-peptidase [Sinorhizobium meliloti]